MRHRTKWEGEGGILRDWGVWSEKVGSGQSSKGFPYLEIRSGERSPQGNKQPKKKS